MSRRPSTGERWPSTSLFSSSSSCSPPRPPTPPAKRRPKPARADYGLTPREIAVLRLLVAGRPDKEIAEVLFISRRSASKYVSAILGKLGVDSRGAAAVRAVQDQLV